MRARSVVTALVALTAGAAASAAVRRLVRSRRPAASAVAAAPRPVDAPQAAARPLAVPAGEVPLGPGAERDAVVLDFARRVPVTPAPAPERPAAPARCGDSGGRTKAGAPCGARATAAGRCHHHRVAA